MRSGQKNVVSTTLSDSNTCHLPSECRINFRAMLSYSPLCHIPDFDSDQRMRREALKQAGPNGVLMDSAFRRAAASF